MKNFENKLERQDIVEQKKALKPSENDLMKKSEINIGQKLDEQKQNLTEVSLNTTQSGVDMTQKKEEVGKVDKFFKDGGKAAFDMFLQESRVDANTFSGYPIVMKQNYLEGWYSEMGIYSDEGKKYALNKLVAKGYMKQEDVDKMFVPVQSQIVQGDVDNADGSNSIYAPATVNNNQNVQLQQALEKEKQSEELGDLLIQ